MNIPQIDEVIRFHPGETFCTKVNYKPSNGLFRSNVTLPAATKVNRDQRCLYKCLLNQSAFIYFSLDHKMME